jgi:hypothetical protein
MRDDLSYKVLVAMKTLKHEGFPFRRTSEHQLKVGRINFYPGKGTIFFDGNKTVEKETGLAAFIKILRSDQVTARLRRRPPADNVKANRPADEQDPIVISLPE